MSYGELAENIKNYFNKMNTASLGTIRIKDGGCLNVYVYGFIKDVVNCKQDLKQILKDSHIEEEMEINICYWNEDLCSQFENMKNFCDECLSLMDGEATKYDKTLFKSKIKEMEKSIKGIRDDILSETISY